jgi:hypothetical protein
MRAGAAGGGIGAVINTSGGDSMLLLRDPIKRSLKWYNLFGVNPAISHLDLLPLYDTIGTPTCLSVPPRDEDKGKAALLTIEDPGRTGGADMGRPPFAETAEDPA